MPSPPPIEKPDEMREEIAHLRRGIQILMGAYLAATEHRPSARRDPIETWIEEHRRFEWERQYRRDMARVDALPDVHDPADR